MQHPPVGRLHVLTDFHFQQRLSHAGLAAAAVAGGADTIQFRQKAGTTRDRLANLLPTVGVCRASGTLCLVDDHLDLALALSDNTVALERGEVIHTGASAALRDDFDLRRKVLWL